MKWINPLKKFFSLFGSFGLRKFSHQSLRWWWGGVCEKSHLNQKCRKFHEMDKSTKNFFHCLAHLDLKNWWFEGHVISNVFQTFSIRVDFIRWSKWGMTTITNYKSQHLASLSYHIQHSSNLYNKAQFHQANKMRGDNPTLTTNPNTLLHIFVIWYPTFFKSSQ